MAQQRSRRKQPTQADVARLAGVSQATVSYVLNNNTAIAVPPEAINMPGYTLLASPTLYPGQTVRAAVAADGANQAPVTCRLYLCTYGANDELIRTYGPETTLAPGAEHAFIWTIADTGGALISEIGIELSAPQRADGSIYLDFLTWDGEPDKVAAWH